MISQSGATLPYTKYWSVTHAYLSQNSNANRVKPHFYLLEPSLTQSNSLRHVLTSCRLRNLQVIKPMKYHHSVLLCMFMSCNIYSTMHPFSLLLPHNKMPLTSRVLSVSSRNLIMTPTCLSLYGLSVSLLLL